MPLSLLQGGMKMKCKVFMSKKTDDWSTPSFIYEQVKRLKMFDPCPLNGIKGENGLDIEWGKRNFVNPPYSKLRIWIEKSIIEHKKGHDVILLIPARTDTKAFALLFEYGSEITFISGRLHFNDLAPAPFPSMLVKLIGGGKINTQCKLVNRESILIE